MCLLMLRKINGKMENEGWYSIMWGIYQCIVWMVGLLELWIWNYGLQGWTMCMDYAHGITVYDNRMMNIWGWVIVVCELWSKSEGRESIICNLRTEEVMLRLGRSMGIWLLEICLGVVAWMRHFTIEVFSHFLPYPHPKHCGIYGLCRSTNVAFSDSIFFSQFALLWCILNVAPNTTPCHGHDNYVVIFFVKFFEIFSIFTT